MTQNSRPLRVLVPMRNHARNGITTYARTVSDELALQGHTVLHWPPTGGWRSGGELGWPFLHPLAAPWLAPLVRTARPDVLMVHHYTQARLALDGELVEVAPPLHFAVRPGELQVLLPEVTAW